MLNITPNCPFCGAQMNLQEMMNGICADCDGETERKRIVHGCVCNTDDVPRPELDGDGNVIDSEPLD